MDDAKKEEQGPTVVIQPPSPASQGSDQASKKKKYVAFGLVAVAVTAIVVVGFILAFYFFAKTTENIMKHSTKFQDDDGNDVSEDVEADLDANTAYFTVDQGKDGMHYVVYDYNRKIATTKVVKDADIMCYVHALNTSMTAINAITDSDEEEKPSSPNTFTLDPNPITNPNFMAPRAVTLCKGYAVHWAIPACMDNEMTKEEMDDKNGREKRYIGYTCRSACCIRLCAARIHLRYLYVYGRLYCTFTYWGYIGHYNYC